MTMYLSILFTAVLSFSSLANASFIKDFSPIFEGNFKGILNVGSPGPFDFTDQSHKGGYYVGNPGHAVVCDDGRVELLDLFEGARKYNYNNFSKKSFDEIKREMISRLALFDKKRADEIAKRFETFVSDTNFTTEYISPQAGLSVTTFPEGCEAAQVAVQHLDVNNFDGKLYTVDKKIWQSDSFGSLNQVALVFHEAFGAEYYAGGFRDTLFLRRLIALIFSDEFNERLELLDKLSFKEKEKFKIVLYYYHRLFDHDYNDQKIRLVLRSFSFEKHVSYIFRETTFIHSVGQNSIDRGFLVGVSSEMPQVLTYDGRIHRLRSLGTSDDYVKLYINKLKDIKLTFTVTDLSVLQVGEGAASFDSILYGMESRNVNGVFHYEDVNIGYRISTYNDAEEFSLIDTSPNYYDKATSFKNNLPEYIYYQTSKRQPVNECLDSGSECFRYVKKRISVDVYNQCTFIKCRNFAIYGLSF